MKRQSVKAIPVPSLVLGADANESLPVLKSLYQHGLEVTAAAPRRISVGLFSRYPVHRLLYPDPVEKTSEFLDWLENRVQLGEFPVTMVCGEDVTAVVARHRKRFDPYTSIPVVDHETFMICRNKANTMRAAMRLGVGIPHTWFPDEEGIECVADQIQDWPVVLKPTESNGARGIRYPARRDELIQGYNSLCEEFSGVIVQEFIPHEGRQYKAELLMGQSGGVLAAGVYDKPRFYPPSGGSSTLNCTIDRPDLIEQAREFLHGIGWFGMADCDFIEDPRDGRTKLMEVNPRFTRSIKILVEAGLDFPWMLYQLARGEWVEPSFEYRKGLYMRYLLSDCMWFLRSPERFTTSPSFFRFFGRNQCGEIFDWSDPMPSLAHVLGKSLKLFDARQRQSILRSGN